MLRRAVLAVAVVAVTLGCLGLATGFPVVQRALSPQADPIALPLSVPGGGFDRFSVEVPRAGRVAIWSTRPTTAPDRDRCAAVDPGGRPIALTEPRRQVEWIEVATDDTLWTWMATLTADTPGRYEFSCRLDPDSLGQRYEVTVAPEGRLAARLWSTTHRGGFVGGLPLGLVLLASLWAAGGLRASKPAPEQTDEPR